MRNDLLGFSFLVSRLSLLVEARYTASSDGRNRFVDSGADEAAPSIVPTRNERPETRNQKRLRLRRQDVQFRRRDSEFDRRTHQDFAVDLDRR
jgi:hypothetical protein